MRSQWSYDNGMKDYEYTINPSLELKLGTLYLYHTVECHIPSAIYKSKRKYVKTHDPHVYRIVIYRCLCPLSSMMFLIRLAAWPL